MEELLEYLEFFELFASVSKETQDKLLDFCDDLLNQSQTAS